MDRAKMYTLNDYHKDNESVYEELWLAFSMTFCTPNRLQTEKGHDNCSTIFAN
jgi:hypothetical protein